MSRVETREEKKVRLARELAELDKADAADVLTTSISALSLGKKDVGLDHEGIKDLVYYDMGLYILMARTSPKTHYTLDRHPQPEVNQGAMDLSLKAQVAAIENYIASVDGIIISRHILEESSSNTTVDGLTVPKCYAEVRKIIELAKGMQATIVVQEPSRLTRCYEFYKREIEGQVAFHITSDVYVMDPVELDAAFKLAEAVPKNMSQCITSRLRSGGQPGTDNPFPGSGILGANARRAVTFIMENLAALKDVVAWYDPSMHDVSDVRCHLNDHLPREGNRGYWTTKDAEKITEGKITAERIQQAIAFDQRKVGREEDRSGDNFRARKGPIHTPEGYRTFRIPELADTPITHRTQRDDDF